MAKPREASKNVNNRGMVLLNTTEFSAVSTVSIDNVFNITYDNYRIILVTTSSEGNNIRFRLRVNSVDNSTASSYITQETRGASSTASALRLVDGIADIYTGTNYKSIGAIDIVDPFLAETTTWTSIGGRDDRVRSIYGRHTQTVSYDGFTVIADTGTITGNVKIYGYKDEIE